MNLVYASDVLRAKEDSAKRYIERAEWIAKQRETAVPVQPESKPVSAPVTGAVVIKETIKETSLTSAVLKGDTKHIAEQTRQALENGADASRLLEEELIPAITEAGNRFEQKKFFLPQLIGAAEAMKAAVEVLEPHLQKDGAKADAGTVVIATVEGDIHDIGKNLVKIMSESGGFEVYDLGRDVPPEKVVETVMAKEIKLVGLSALMTTTLGSMENTIAAVKAAAPDCKLMVGGAVLTPDFAERIGADYYCKDAMKSVEAANGVFA
jgi:5-methyltetrahydrofolate--homocysteine methyltransferase